MYFFVEGWLRAFLSSVIRQGSKPIFDDLMLDKITCINLGQSLKYHLLTLFRQASGCIVGFVFHGKYPRFGLV